MKTYANLVDFAEAVAREGLHDAKIGRQRYTSAPVEGFGELVIFSVRGGMCYPVERLLHDERLRRIICENAARL